MNNKQTINPEHAKMFEQLFGSESADPNANILNPELQKKIDKANNPMALRLIDSFFSLLTFIFAKFVPCCVVACTVFNIIQDNSFVELTFIQIFSNIFVKIIPSILGSILFAAIAWAVLNLLCFAFQAIVIAIYSNQIKRMIVDYSKTEAKIKNKLNDLDKKDKVFTDENGEKYSPEDIQNRTEYLKNLMQGKIKSTEDESKDPKKTDPDVVVKTTI